MLNQSDVNGIGWLVKKSWCKWHLLIWWIIWCEWQAKEEEIKMSETFLQRQVSPFFSCRPFFEFRQFVSNFCSQNGNISEYDIASKTREPFLSPPLKTLFSFRQKLQLIRDHSNVIFLQRHIKSVFVCFLADRCFAVQKGFALLITMHYARVFSPGKIAQL